jgi:hypothetical protein
MMGWLYPGKTCSVCKQAIKFGCDQTCIICGRCTCNKHGFHLRYRMSKVLFSLCVYCFLGQSFLHLRVEMK